VARASTLGAMENCMTESGSTGRNTGTDCGRTSKVTATSDSGFQTPHTDTEFMNGITATGTRGSGDIR
jgi:hypothetical protein